MATFLYQHKNKTNQSPYIPFYIDIIKQPIMIGGILYVLVFLCSLLTHTLSQLLFCKFRFGLWKLTYHLQP